MAAIPVTIVGTWTSADGLSVGGTLVGSASYTDLGPGGGPIMPPSGPGTPEHPIAPQPPGIWGPPGPWPTPPIAMPQPPVDPGYSPPWAQPKPPGIWGPTDPRPSNPIAGIPGLPGYEPPPIGGGPPVRPPDAGGGGGNWEWVWSPGAGWHPGFVPGDKPQPPPIGGNPPGGGNGGGGTPPVDPDAPHPEPVG